MTQQKKLNFRINNSITFFFHNFLNLLSFRFFYLHCTVGRFSWSLFILFKGFYFVAYKIFTTGRIITIIRNSIFDYYSWSNWYALLDFIVILLDTKRGKRQQTPKSIGIKSSDIDLLTNELLNKHIMIWSKLFLLRHRIYVNSPGKPCIIIIDAYVKRSKN